MSIFAHLKEAWNAVAGDSNEQANDVRSLYSIMTLGVFDRPLKNTQSTAICQQADAMPHQTNDGALPSNPFFPPSPAASRPATTAPIDLTSPKRGSRSSDPRNTQTKGARSSLLKNSRSEDEKRLVGDFEYECARARQSSRRNEANVTGSVPADSVSAPHPGSYFQKKAMPKVCCSTP